MKLGILKATIRGLDQAPRIRVNFGTAQMDIHCQKTPLLAELDAAFPSGKATETGLTLTPDGYLTRETQETS